jgi:hypothetical protein
MAASYAGVLALPTGRDYFELVTPDPSTWAVVAVCSVVGGLLVAAGPRLLEGRE